MRDADRQLRDRAIRELTAGGWTVPELARLFKVSSMTIKRHRRKTRQAAGDLGPVVEAFRDFLDEDGSQPDHFHG